MDTKIIFQPELIEILAKLPSSSSIFDSSWFTTTLSVLIGAIFSYLASYLNNRQNQSHNIALRDKEAEIKKQEALHAQQLSALQAISKIYNTITPIDWTHPDYSSEDAHTDIASVMPSLIPVLGEFLANHGYLLPREVEEKIRIAIHICNENKWGAVNQDGPNYEPTKAELDAAGKVLATLTSSIESLKATLGIAK
jgi:hypothetical protein